LSCKLHHLEEANVDPKSDSREYSVIGEINGRVSSRSSPLGLICIKDGMMAQATRIIFMSPPRSGSFFVKQTFHNAQHGRRELHMKHPIGRIKHFQFQKSRRIGLRSAELLSHHIFKRNLGVPELLVQPENHPHQKTRINEDTLTCLHIEELLINEKHRDFHSKGGSTGTSALLVCDTFFRQPAQFVHNATHHPTSRGL
jgi:hypothetical protein